MTSSFLLQKHDTEIAQTFDDLVQESLRSILIVTAMLVSGWAAVVVFFPGPHVTYALVVLGVIVATIWASYRLHVQRQSVAVGVYLSGLTVAVTIIALTFQDTSVFYLYMQVVLITAILTNPRVTWWVALASVGLLATVVGLSGRAIRVTDLTFPILFVLLTALTAGLSSRRLFTALAWALTMTKQAQKNADEAQKNRAEAQRVLKSLELTYVRLERVNQDLIFARAAAEKAYRFKAEFVANVSHELRTPLNLIVGFSEMMATAPESYGGVPLPSQYRGDVMATYRSARHLSDLIDDVLDLSQIEAGRMPLIKERADLGEVIHEAADMVHGLAHARGIRLELDLPDDLPALRLDRTRVRQVLLNLLTNATRFTEKGWLRVQVRTDAREVVVTVEDSGCGIPSDRLARAFEAFSQLHEDHIPEGSGLGLAVSKKFIELHGGRMWIESEVGRGTTVSFTLPIPKEEQETPPAPLRMGVSLRSHDERPLVLVLHEDARILGLLHRHVDGYQFLMADAVDKARDIVQEALPVAVIADTAWADRWSAFIPDLNLPPHVPLVTCPLPSLRRVGLLLGATDYLPKPVARADLENALSRLPRPPQTVLVVDDDPHVVRLLARMLKAINPSLRVWEAFGGKEGLEIARSQRPDVMLLDLFMPELSGFDLLEEMARDEAMANMQIIIVSVRSVEQEATPIMGELRLGRKAGFSLTEILRVLQATLSTVTQPVAGFPASAATRLAAQPG